MQKAQQRARIQNLATEPVAVSNTDSLQIIFLCKIGPVTMHWPTSWHDHKDKMRGWLKH